jgi:hypothetical protein
MRWPNISRSSLADPERMISADGRKLLKLSYRLDIALKTIARLKKEAVGRKILNDRWIEMAGGVPVLTCGNTSPASGTMLWKDDNFALVWFYECDRPVVWPVNCLEVVHIPVAAE